jgi:hypothetical protein
MIYFPELLASGAVNCLLPALAEIVFEFVAARNAAEILSHRLTL